MSKFGTRRANGSINTRTRSIQSYHLRQRSLTAAFALLDPSTGQELSVEGYAETSGLRDRLPEIGRAKDPGSHRLVWAPRIVVSSEISSRWRSLPWQTRSSGSIG